MKIVLLSFLVAALAIVECHHTFLGTNVQRPMVYHHQAHYKSSLFRKKVKELYFTLPSTTINFGRRIQGILAYDQTHTEATANVTQGGIGFTYVNLRMKSERSEPIKYDVYIYA